MKAYKIKSLIYLSCFVIAAVVYYNIEQNEIFQNTILAAQTAEMEAEDHSEIEDTKKEEEMEKGR